MYSWAFTKIFTASKYSIYIFLLSTLGGAYTPYRFWLHYFPILISFNLVTTPLVWIKAPLCNLPNRGDMAPNLIEEETLRLLVDNFGIYDYLDGIMDLKSKYSHYEVNQLTKEISERKKSVIMREFKTFQNKAPEEEVNYLQDWKNDVEKAYHQGLASHREAVGGNRDSKVL